MAVTKIIPIKTTLSKAICYIENHEKTDSELYISGYNVDPHTAHIEFEMTSQLAKDVRGNYDKTGGENNLAYHIVQSFSPEDNLMPSKAHELGIKFANEFLQGKYEYVIATHIDKGHLHNHIIFNAISFYDYKKFYTAPYKTVKKMRNISDKLCKENNLYVIENPKVKGKSQYELLQRKKGLSWKAKLENILDEVITNSKSYDEFIKGLNENNVTVKDGKHIAFLMPQQQRFIRGKTLNEIYDKKNILQQIKNNVLKEIKVNKILIYKENEIFYFIKLPKNENLICVPKEHSQWIFNKTTLKIDIIKDKNYTLVNKKGEIIKRISGDTIDKYFLVEKQIEKNLSEKNLSEIEKEYLKKQEFFENKELKKENTKELATALFILSENKISNIKDINIKIESFINQNKDIKETIKITQIKCNEYSKVAKLLKVCQEIEKKDGLSINDNEKLNYALDQLDKLEISSNVDYTKVLCLVKQQTKKIDNLNDQIKTNNTEINKLNKATATINCFFEDKENNKNIREDL
ncbi:MAG: relaxase/mobilization nuclease domain-containing protein [Oscillospiraceae bacterium]